MCLSLILVMQYNVLQVQSCGPKWHYSISCSWGVVSICVFVPKLLYPCLSWWTFCCFSVLAAVSCRQSRVGCMRPEALGSTVVLSLTGQECYCSIIRWLSFPEKPPSCSAVSVTSLCCLLPQGCPSLASILCRYLVMSILLLLGGHTLSFRFAVLQ